MYAQRRRRFVTHRGVGGRAGAPPGQATPPPPEHLSARRASRAAPEAGAGQPHPAQAQAQAVRRTPHPSTGQ